MMAEIQKGNIHEREEIWLNTIWLLILILSFDTQKCIIQAAGVTSLYVERPPCFLCSESEGAEVLRF